MEKINFEEKTKQNNNEFQTNTHHTNEETNPKEKHKKKNYQRYKFHIFHHNNILKKIKSTGIDMNIVDNILNTNASLILQLLKNSKQNDAKKNMGKDNNDAVNIIQSLYQSIVKNNEKNNNNNGENENAEMKEKRFKSFANDNTIQFPIKLDDFTKAKFLANSKGKASADFTQNKKMLTLNEANNFKFPFMKEKNIKSSITKYKRLSFPFLIQKEPKKSNSTIDVFTANSNSNNSIFVNNKKSNFKNTFTNLKKYKNISYINNRKKPNFINKNRIRSKSVLNQPHIKGGVNFKKMLSRDYLNRLGVERVDGVYSTVTPNYEPVEPKCIMKVSYSNKRHSVQNSSFKGLGGEATFNMDKLFYKYNNHNPPKSFNLEKMAGRGKYLITKLPVFMLNSVDRNSFNFFNEKNLKMNFYSNGHLQQIISDFNNKKSFNFKLNDKSDEKTEEQINFENYAKQIFEKGIENNNHEIKSSDEEGAVIENRIINSIPFRVNSLFKNFMSEYKRKDSYSEKIDGITFKNFKKSNKIRSKTLI